MLCILPTLSGIYPTKHPSLFSSLFRELPRRSIRTRGAVPANFAGCQGPQVAPISNCTPELDAIPDGDHGCGRMIDHRKLPSL